MRYIINLAIGLAACLAAVTSSLADDRYDEYPPAERFKLRIGGFLIDRFDTTARFDSTQFPIGTLIDLEEDFNVDASETVIRIDGFYRFNRQHRIDWTYYRSRRNGTNIARQDYIIGDPDDPEGGFVIPKDSRIRASWNFDLLKVGYAWSFLNKRRYELIMSVHGEEALAWEGEASGDGDTPRAWLRTKANSIEGGTSEIQLNIIAKRVLGLPS